MADRPTGERTEHPDERAADARRRLIAEQDVQSAPAWMRLSDTRVEQASEFEHTADIPALPRDYTPTPIAVDRATLSVRERPAETDSSPPVPAEPTEPAPPLVRPAAAVTVAPPAPPPVMPASDAPVEAPGREMVVPSDALEVRVPVMEERLVVEKRPTVEGEVIVERRITEEQATVEVEVFREQLHVSRRDVTARPLQDRETAQPFVERTLHVPVFGERALARKQQVVTGEVVVHRTAVPEHKSFTDMVRRERVEVEEDYATVQPVLREDFNRKQEETGDLTRTFEEAEPNYRRGYHAALEPRFAGREFAEVEPELRNEYEHTQPTEARVSSASRWRQILDEVRSGWSRARERG